MKRHHASGGKIATETRGGDRRLEEFAEKKLKLWLLFKSRYFNHITIDIGQLIENTCRLNTKKLCEMYNTSVELEFNVKESYFREVINTNFNFGFGSPKTDAC